MRLCARALNAYVSLDGGRNITERLNAFYGQSKKAKSRLDLVIEAMTLELLCLERW